MNKQDKHLLQNAIAALSNEMEYTTGGWHFANLSKIKNCSLQFQKEDTKSFLFQVVQWLRKLETTADSKFKLAQLLNMLKSYDVAGFSENINLFRNQINSAYFYMGDSPLADASLSIIGNLWKTHLPIKTTIRRSSNRFARIKTSTPSANVMRNMTMHNEPPETTLKHSTPPPFLIE